MLSRLNRILPLPYPHFMGFAPLDVWWRVLTQNQAWKKIPPRYALRIAGGLFTSSIATAITLPERLLLAPFLRTPRYPRAAPPPTLFVLGYYRSGTTHLHYLLSCDPNLVTPRWYQMLAPQGFALSWTFLRYFLVPFLSSTRPQDDVAYGTEYPAEDDFGLCNWSACGTMPGRMALPNCWDYYSRFHALTNLTPAEMERFRRTQCGLTWKLALLNPRRTLLLKTPAHTARVNELRRMYGTGDGGGGGTKFIHLHRDPTPVVKSNVAMHRRYAPFLFQPHPGDEEIRRRVIAEYDATERLFEAQTRDLPPSTVARIRYEDLIADPIGELKRAYDQLGLPLTPEFARRAVTYLESVREYRAASEKPADASAKDHNQEPVAPAPELEWMHTVFGHDRPAVPKHDPAKRASELGLLALALGTPTLRVGSSALGTPTLRGGSSDHHAERGATPADAPLLTAWTASLIAAAFSIAVWLLVASLTRNRLDWLAWPVGVAIGSASLRGAGANNKRGTTALGLWSLLLTISVILITAFPATWLSVRDTFSPINLSHHVWLATYRGVLAWNNVLWIGLGLMTAYRFASRKHVRPPGL